MTKQNWKTLISLAQAKGLKTAAELARMVRMHQKLMAGGRP